MFALETSENFWQHSMSNDFEADTLSEFPAILSDGNCLPAKKLSTPVLMSSLFWGDA
jgi:hypothetical protein